MSGTAPGGARRRVASPPIRTLGGLASAARRRAVGGLRGAVKRILLGVTVE